MAGRNEHINHTFDDSTNILVGTITISSLDKDEAQSIYDFVKGDIANFPDYENYILDVTSVTEATNPSLGILLKSLGLVKKTGDYMVLVLTEEFLQKLMLEHSAMFDVFAVFHNLADAREYILSKR
jgi:CRISPR/Cas system-associated protein Cas10 (large subunit of type III CRISPR-Cas system)